MFIKNNNQPNLPALCRSGWLVVIQTIIQKNCLLIFKLTTHITISYANTYHHIISHHVLINTPP